MKKVLIVILVAAFLLVLERKCNSSFTVYDSAGKAYTISKDSADAAHKRAFENYGK